MKNNNHEKLGKNTNRLKRKSRVATRKVTRAIKNQPLSKKIGIPTKIILSLLLIYFIVLSYFLLIIYLKPRSIPILTDKINQALQENLGSNYHIKDSWISFNSGGNLVISTKKIQEIDLSASKSYLSKINFGEIALEIPLSRLIFFNFKPKKIAINDSLIEANYFYQPEKAEEILANNQSLTGSTKESFFNKLIGFIDNDLERILVKKLPIAEITLNNIELAFKKNQKIYDKIILSKSTLKLVSNREVARFISNNNAKFDRKDLDVYFNFGCQILLNGTNYPDCQLFVQNIRANSLAKSSSKLSFLEPIEAIIDINSSFKMTKSGFDDVRFSLKSKKGSFDYDQFFDSKIKFTNMEATGIYNHKLGEINLENIKAKLKSDLNPDYKLAQDIDLQMSLLISGLQEEASQDFNFKIKLEKVSGSEISKFWPISLPRQDIREWVATHIGQGLVNKAYTNFKISKSNQDAFLDSIEADIDFSGLNLVYDDFFPEIDNINGSAKFNKGSMFIELDSGNVLETKINKASVAIKDFFAPVNVLEIKTQSLGVAEDLFKHINYKSNYSQNIKDFINGQAISNISINLPLREDIALQDVEIDATSQISNIKTDLIEGEINVECKKRVNSNNFISKIDLENAKIKIPVFAIEKEPKIPANLDLNVTVDEKNITISNISLIKINDLSAFGGKVKKSKISGDVNYSLEDEKIRVISLKNHNFGNNDYKLEYLDNNLQKNYVISGSKIDLATFVNYELPVKNPKKFEIADSKFSINIASANLMNDKIISNLYAYLDCQSGFCQNGIIKTNYNQNNFLNLALTPNPAKQSSQIKAKITDISYLAEGLGITSLLQGGNIEIDGENNFTDGKNNISAKFKSLDKVTFFETSRIKDLAQDDLFSQVKDTIFSSGKTVFSNMSGEIEIVDNKIFVNSFVANNFKVGVTARGLVDLSNKSFDFRGMIVPGYIVNNLFGIGKIPIVGNVVTGLLTGGEEGGGLFGIRYSYSRESKLHKEKLVTEKVKSFIPSSIKNLFD